MNIYLNCLVLDGVYRRGSGGAPEFVEVPAPTDEALQTVLHKIIIRMMKLLTRRGVLVEEEGSTYMADNDGDSDEARTLRPLQAAACTYRIALGPRAGQKVLTLQGLSVDMGPPLRAGPCLAKSSRLQARARPARHAQGDGLQANAVRRHQRAQPARRRALRR